MSKLHIRRIRMALESQFDGLIDLDPVQRSPEAQRAMFMTQALAAYVLTNQTISQNAGALRSGV